jgi:hypothetical protein
MVVPTFVCLILATLVRAFIHDVFLSLANSMHASSLMVSTPSTSASSLSLTVSQLCHHLHPRCILAPHQMVPLCDRSSCAASSTSANSTLASLTSATSSTTFSTMATRPSLLAISTSTQRDTTLLNTSITTSVLLPL